MSRASIEDAVAGAALECSQHRVTSESTMLPKQKDKSLARL
jgi:hypothetical protein